MSKKVAIILVIILVLLIAGVALFMIFNKPKENEEEKNDNLNTSEEENISVKKDSNKLVLYFSATGNTKNVAKYISENIDCDILEIVPKNKYSDDDLNYNKSNSRANVEQNDIDFRPEILNKLELENYDTIFLGFPIWWGDVPKIILTLFDNYKLDGKTIIPFCTSGSTGISESMNTLKEYNKNVNFIDGKRFSSYSSKEEVDVWLKELNIVSKKEESKMYIKVNDRVLTATMEENSSVEELLKKLEEGNITINMSDYANFEKVGPLGFSLPRNDKQITTTPGDIILYQGNSITIYYDTNSWNFTKLGHIDNITQEELKSILGTGDVTVKLMLRKE